MENKFYIADKLIQKGSPPVFLPDIGTFFDNDIARAISLVNDIKDAGADIVKAEILHNANICLKSEVLERYVTNEGIIASEPYRDLIERKVVSLADYEKIFSHCKNLQLPFVVSVYDFEGALFAKKMGAAALKIASSNIVHAPLIRYVSNLGLPVLIDTGKSTIEEVALAIGWFEESNNRQLIIEHSPNPPPADVSEHHLCMLQGLEERFCYPVGLSCHHHGEEMLYAATAMGVNVLEKGIAFTDNKDDQDVYHALPIHQLKNVLKKCQNIHLALGQKIREQTFPRPAGRMGLVAKKDIQKGEILTLDNVDFAFPTVSIPVEEWDLTVNKKASRLIPMNTPIMREAIE